MLRKEKHLYIAAFKDGIGNDCAKIGISHNPVIRLDSLNGAMGYRRKGSERYSLYAVFSLSDTKLAAEIENMVCKKFPPLFRKEYLDQHPEKVFRYCWKVLEGRGIKKHAIWRHDQQETST